ncbi:hypothetical protein HOU47_gp48 [Arthrobacter phage Constance]|uniref:Uncharacterized protein n=1 Tax=Arthrobacter phage Constance TaxID=2419950 RepID=A0A3G2KEP0_9CAUD|nr:hypothetical protein HOU47_gp48 [Arthrobacter phage Constance]AYN57454.1 hypothetical protein PBI_CONSTANCE_48 [Arthrobacter phage Constance]
MTETQTEEYDDIQFYLRQRPRLEITQQVFGLTPYVIIRPEPSEDDGEPTLNIEAGGGMLLADLVEGLEAIVDTLKLPSVAAQIEAETRAAIAAAQEEDPDEE